MVGGLMVAVAAAALAPLLAVRAAGQGSSHTAVGAQYCQDFVGHLSHELGVSNDRVQSAMARAARETVDDAAVKGTLTRQQADAIKARISDRSICSSDLRGIDVGGAMRDALLSAAASALGASTDQLRRQLDQGKSVSQIAPAGMTEQQFESKLRSSLRKELDAQVRAGKLTQAQEDAALSRVPAMAQRLWTQGTHASPAPSHSPPTR
jgi:ribosomal protein S20